jgi:hypothetical protein
MLRSGEKHLGRWSCQCQVPNVGAGRKCLGNCKASVANCLMKVNSEGQVNEVSEVARDQIILNP